jgi:hypothetical protein
VNVNKIIIVISLLISGYTYAAPEIATCHITDAELFGTYNAIQEQAYAENCILSFSSPNSLKVVPIGNNGNGESSRITLTPAIDTQGNDAVAMKLNGTEDDTLAGGTKSREEIATCFITQEEFNALSEDEKSFRRVAGDFYRGCAQSHGREVAYDFYLDIIDSTEHPYTQLDSIIVQLHAMNDKQRYCIPNSGTPKETCDQSTGTLGSVERNAAAYNDKLAEGAVFETSIQPPLSFRLKDGFFSIVATSSLKDPTGNIIDFSPSKICSININNVNIGEVKACNETGKTSTVLYREKLGNGVIAANEYMHFRISIKWPSKEDNDKLIKIEYLPKADPMASVILVDDSDTPFGTFDDEYPYFKAGVYRQNANAIPAHSSTWKARIATSRIRSFNSGDRSAGTATAAPCSLMYLVS